MKCNKTYNIFLFLSTLTRNLVNVFSLVLLYKKGYTINNLLFFLFMMYLMGILVNYFSLKIYYKVVLIISSIIYGISFIYLSFLNKSLISLSILAILLAIGNYSYHTIRHFLALTMFKKGKQDTGVFIMINYLSIIGASLVGMYLIKRLSLTVTSIIVFILSFISIIPILRQPRINIDNSRVDKRVSISKNKIIFNILEQFKVIFMELQPLFLFIYVDKSIYYVGIFNVITNIASLIVIYFISRKISYKYFKYYTLILSLILILKLNIKRGIILLIIAFLEGVFVKVYEYVSLSNLYDYKDNNVSNYLLFEELIFFGSKTLILLLYLLFNLDIYSIMYINIVGIIISGLFIRYKGKCT